jgi:hypothetical protein
MAEITRCRSWWSDRVYVAFVEAVAEARETRQSADGAAA